MEKHNESKENISRWNIQMLMHITNNLKTSKDKIIKPIFNYITQ